MTPEQLHPGAVGLQNLRDQQSQLAVAQHRYALTWWNLDLIQNFTSRGDWLDEDRLFV